MNKLKQKLVGHSPLFCATIAMVHFVDRADCRCVGVEVCDKETRIVEVKVSSLPQLDFSMFNELNGSCPQQLLSVLRGLPFFLA